MDKELKAKWVKALRSGEYEQGRHNLHNATTNRFCCLGVLMKVNGHERDEFNYSSYSGLKPQQITELVGMNDMRGKSFPEIADWIEEHL